MFTRYPVLFAAALALLASAHPVAAQDPRFEPLMAGFAGESALVLAPSPALDINGYGTIEFWVRAGWTRDPGYDPAIMAYSGPKGVRFAFHLTGNARALGIQAGPYYDTVDFDFSDGRMHYVAITAIGDTITVMIDGELQDVLGFGFADLPAQAFSIGSVGRYSPFIGDIGQIRIWDEPIDPDVLVAYSWRALSDAGADRHPDADALVGISVFGNPELGGFVFAGEPDDPEIATAPDGSTDQPGLDPDAPDGMAAGS